MSDFFIDIFGYELIADSSLRMLVRMVLTLIAFHILVSFSNLIFKPFQYIWKSDVSKEKKYIV